MRKLIKTFVSVAAYYLHLWPLVFGLCRFRHGRPVLAVFMFHRINSGQPNDKYLQGYERGISRETYERQIDQIARLYRIIDLEEFKSIVTGESAPAGRKPMALLSYDDADKDHPPFAFAKLERHGFSGVSFVPTGFIDTKKRFYHVRLTNICNLFGNEAWAEVLQTDIPPDVKTVIESFLPDIAGRRREFRRRLIAPFEAFPPAERDKLLHSWEEKIDLAFDLDIRCMDWGGVKKLPASGIAIGSHTVNHNRLALLGTEDKSRELTESRAVLERETGTPVESICYPEGSYDDETLTLSAQAGYSLGFTTVAGLIDYPRRERDLLTIPRVEAGGGADHEIAFSLGSQAFKKLVG